MDMERHRWFYLKKMQMAAKNILSFGQNTRIKVVTGSMMPLIKPGTYVTVYPKKKNPVKRGDVVLMSQYFNGSLMIHRCLLVIRWFGKKYYLTKGDAGFTVDKLVSENRMLGKVLLKESFWYSLWFRNIQVIFFPLFMIYRYLYEIVMKLLNRTRRIQGDE